MDGALDIINQGWAFLEAAFGPLGPFYAIGAFGALFVALSAPALLRRRPDPLEKLGRGRSPFVARSSGETPTAAPSLRFDSKSGKDFGRFAEFLEPQDQKELSAVRLKLIQAGYRSKSAVSAYHFARFALGMTFLVIGVVVLLVRQGEPGIPTIILSVLLPAFAGYYAPIYWVTRRQQTRQGEIRDGFPDALDLMLVCVEAGQSLDQAIMRVAEETRNSHPTLSEEFEIVSSEIRAGKERVTVLRDLAERCGVPDIASFTTVLIQSAMYGTSVATALRVYAAEMRDKRVMRAEEKANVLPTKLTIGTMMFTVPPLLIILIGPSLYEIWRTIGGGQ
ncbi:MAG: type II secretion system F family protein [Alphaproteobacteria bacterium]|nr:MAG: type II secretion system F family protein [Alphaproteobacteria bacterium]